MTQSERSGRRGTALGLAAAVVLGGLAAEQPAEAKGKYEHYCSSGDDWDDGTTARGWCYKDDNIKDLRLYVWCKDQKYGHPNEAKFDKEMDIRRSWNRPPMRLKAAEFKCGKLGKVVNHMVTHKDQYPYA